MRLLSLKVEPQGSTGWTSEELVFGNEITELYGPNGCGKTPMIQSIAYCLGYPIKYREDVLAKCAAAVLTIESEIGVLRLRRKIGDDFDVEVQTADGATQSFYKDREYSAYLLKLFGFAVPILTTVGSDPTPPYMATLLPIFYLDQDHGYRSQYHAPNPFIRDQYAEMMRLVFGLPPKHSFEQKKLIYEKRQRLAQLDRAIVKRRQEVEELMGELGSARRELPVVDAETADIQARLNKLKESKSVKSDAYTAIDALIYEKHVERRALSGELADLQQRVGGIERIQSEIEVEVATLSLNEEARRVFSSFKDICANPQCGLFLGSSESYGKNLLYLRDQLKDLKRNTERQKQRIDELVETTGQITSRIHDLEARQTELSDGTEAAALVQAIRDLTSRLIEVERERRDLASLAEAEKAYLSFMNEREVVQNDLASLSTSVGTSDLRAIELRMNWRTRIRYWLDVLKTPNVSLSVEADADFGLLFGEEKVTQFKGSTLVRVVLAIHTATFETYLQDKANRFRFFILDTPRQQDIDRDAMASYISELKKVAQAHSAQIVFSTTDYHYPCIDGDREWTPTFPGLQQPMFLGTPSSPPPEAGSW
jgi:predicted  nucleic acid-binding Zn-ribbon protein